MPTATVCIAKYYGDNNFVIQIFAFIACSDAARMTCSTADTDSHVTCSTDMDVRVTRSEKHGFL